MTWEEIDKEFDLLSQYMKEYINRPVPRSNYELFRLYKETGNMIVDVGHYMFPSFAQYKYYLKYP